MDLPVSPPLSPMLCRLARELPAGDHLFEPKWDGFRCLAFRAGDAVDLRSRNERPLARYFPEIAAALRALSDERIVLDGELIVPADGRLDFEALLRRLHPAASRVERLAREAPALLVAFDLLALGHEDLRGRPFAERRERLVAALEGAGEGVVATPATGDPAVARDWLARLDGDGIDGIVAKRRDLPYLPGRRAMTKVKVERTAELVVAGFRFLGDRPLPSTLLLGAWDGETLEHVGVAGSFAERQRGELLEAVAPHAAPLAGHPWEHGFLTGGSPIGRLSGAAGRWTPDMELDWVPLAPRLVCEVAYDHLDGRRLRHVARFRRWRPDRDARSCTFEQFEGAPLPLAELSVAA